MGASFAKPLDERNDKNMNIGSEVNNEKQQISFNNIFNMSNAKALIHPVNVNGKASALRKK